MLCTILNLSNKNWTGLTNPDKIIGPKNVLGTTPGNSK